MALSRRSGGRLETNIWPGFVDAMTALLLILMFVMSIFMIIQFTMSEKITGQSKELDDLNRQLSGLANVLSLERDRSAALESEVGTLQSNLSAQRAEADRLNAAMAALVQARDVAQARSVELENSLSETVSEREALAAALASTRTEMDMAVETARLAAARREAMEALVADLQAKDAGRDAELAAITVERSTALAMIQQLRAERAEREASLAESQSELAELQTKLTVEEEAKLLEAAAAEALRRKLEEGTAELDAMTLALEKARKEAEDTLILLAAAESAKQTLEGQLSEESAAIDRELALRRLAESELSKAKAQTLVAESELSKAKAQTLEEQKQVALLNAQTRELREQLGGIQALLDESESRDAEAQVQIARLGERLNAALAQKVGELARFRSVFFEKMEQVLGGRQDIQRVGDRFIFQSEVLFAAGSATLGPEGQAELAKLGEVLRAVAGEMPDDLNWILRIDGHTDKIPVGGARRYRDNWELSQARALSVVKYLVERENVPPHRLAAAGFGEFQPIDDGDTTEALAKNRRIEFKFTER
jgi:chemotaxis protein MotB